MRLFISLFTLVIGLLFGNSLMANTTVYIQGYVTDFTTGDAIPNATVTYVSVIGEVVIKKTDAIGFYSFALVSDNQATIIYEADGYQTQRKSIKPQNNGTTRVDCELYPKLPAPGFIVGQITDSSLGLEIQGATVQLFQGGVLLETVTSEQRGVYLFQSRQAGSYIVTATANGYQSSSQGALITSGGTTHVNFPLDQNPGSVSGIITDSEDNRLSGIIISILSNGVTIKSTTTDNLGQYSVTGLAPGNYQIWATSNDYQSGHSGVTIVAGQNATANFKLKLLPGDLNGYVRDNNGNPLQNALISVFINNVKVTFIQTDALGYYAVQGLTAGSYTISAQLAGYKTQILGTTIKASLTSTLDFNLNPNPGDMIGIVFNSAKKTIEGALVIASLNNIQVGSTLTNKSGQYTFQNLMPGSYVVTVSASGYRGESSGGIVFSDESTAVNFALNPTPGIIAGHAEDSNGNPLSGVFIQININGIIAGQAITDNGGRYNIPGLSPGSYQVLANLSGYQTGIVGATVVAEQIAIADFTLIANPGDIDGNVSTIGLSAISGAEIKIFLNNIEIASAFTDNDGNYSFSGLPPGPYIITASAADYRRGFLGGNVLSNQTSTFNFLLAPSAGNIIGNVSNAKGKPLSGVLIQVSVNGVNISTILTDNQGNYSMSGLASGSYILTASAPKYGTKAVGSIVKSNQTSIADLILTENPGAIEGKVTDRNGSPLSGVTIDIHFSNNSFTTILTDNTGYYHVGGLTPESYIVLASIQGYQIDIKNDVLVKANQTAVVNFSLASKSSTVTGIITDLVTHLPISGAIVSVIQGEQIIKTAITDNNGNYIITMIGRGNYTLSATASEYFPGNTSFSIDSGVTIRVDLGLKPTLNHAASVTGEIYDCEKGKKKPISRALVQLFQGELFIDETFTDNQGFYLFSPLNEGKYTISVPSKNYICATTSFSVELNETAKINLPLCIDNPPRDLKVKVRKNTFATQTDQIDHLTWKASKSRAVKYYAIYLNNKLIAKIPPSSRLAYNNHNQSKDKTRVYAVIAVYKSGAQSSAAKVKIE